MDNFFNKRGSNKQQDNALEKDVSSREPKSNFDYLKLFNFILMLAVLGFLSYLSFEWFSYKGPDALSIGGHKGDNADETIVKDIFEPNKGPGESFDEYEKIINGRDIFEQPWEKVVEKKVIEKPVIEKKVVVEKKVPLDKRLRIIGIVIDNNPQAVIEDLKKKETVFVNIGDEISEAKVQDIKQDRVIFLYDGETVELEH